MPSDGDHEAVEVVDGVVAAFAVLGEGHALGFGGLGDLLEDFAP